MADEIVYQWAHPKNHLVQEMLTLGEGNPPARRKLLEVLTSPNCPCNAKFVN